MMLSATQWQHAKEILADALELHASERDAFVVQRCADAPALLSEVRLLLEHADGVTAFSRPPASGDPVPPSVPDLRGRRAGAYVLTEPIGQGGMGVVYAAVRADGAYEQKVAVKLLKGGLSSDLDIRRMARERQALAALSHPNIARLLDGGNTEDGIPYLVMELVEGVPIDAYCKAARLCLRDRVALMVSVCGAVQAAHQQLLIHRDIKPSNILVTADGIAKLLDFGVARLIESDIPADHTQEHRALFTPRYASPEQIRGLPVSVATDVHGIGLLLYDLLAGASPYEGLGNNASHGSAADMMRVVLDDSPKRASQIAHAVMPGNVRQLRGDLDTVLLKACSKEPRARYAMVADLAADLQRWLDGKPVKAKPQAWHYVARKFIGRHQTGSLLGLLAVCGIAVGIGATILQKNEAVRQQGIATARAAQVRQFANQMIFTYYDAIESLSGSLSVRKKLVQDALVYLDSLGGGAAEDPELAVELAIGYRRLGHILFNGVHLPHLGDEAGGAAARKKSLALLDAVLERHPDNVKANAAWAETASDMAALLGSQGEIPAAIDMLQRSAKRYAWIMRLHPRDSETHYELIKTLLRTAQAALNGGQSGQAFLDEADKEFQRWAQSNASNPERHNMEAYLVRTQQRQAGKEKDLPRVFALLAREIALMDLMLAAEPDNDTHRSHKSNALNSIGVYKYTNGSPQEGLHYLRRGEEILKALVARDPADHATAANLARAYTHQGNALIQLQDKGKALVAYRSASALYALHTQADHPARIYKQAAEAHYHLSQLLAEKGERAGARAAAQGVISMAAKSPDAFTDDPAAGWLLAARGRTSPD